MFKIIVQGILFVLALFVIGAFPALTVGATAVVIVLAFLVFGKE